MILTKYVIFPSYVFFFLVQLLAKRNRRLVISTPFLKTLLQLLARIAMRLTFFRLCSVQHTNLYKVLGVEFWIYEHRLLAPPKELEFRLFLLQYLHRYRLHYQHLHYQHQHCPLRPLLLLMAPSAVSWAAGAVLECRAHPVLSFHRLHLHHCLHLHLLPPPGLEYTHTRSLIFKLDPENL